MAGTVFISGAGGYIASHVIDLLLKKGYKVIGSVQTEEEGQLVYKNFHTKHPEGDFEYVTVADVVVDGAFDDIFKANPGINYVIHTAAPVTRDETGDAERLFIAPARNGALNALRAAHNFGPNVERVVITASFASIINWAKPGTLNSESTWNPVPYEAANTSNVAAYAVSKIVAERAAWDFMKTTPGVKFQMTSMNPPYVIGPQLFESAFERPLNASVMLYAQILALKPGSEDAEILKKPGATIDVRDVAKFYLCAVEKPDMANQRLLPIQALTSHQEILNLIHKNLPQLEGKLTKGHPELAQEYSAKNDPSDNSKTNRLCGVEYIDLETTVTDTFAQIIKHKSL